MDAALSHKVDIPNSCRAGICQTCLVKVQEGFIPPEAQQGLNEQQVEQNLALACQLRPNDAIVASNTTANTIHSAHIVSLEKLTHNIIRLRLESDIDWFPGQHLTIWKDRQTGRPYSIASLPGEGFLEFHIRVHNHGCVSQWIGHQLTSGNRIEISAARGNCFYHSSLRQKPILLIGAGTGLAPLYGIGRDALAQSHPARIDLLLTNSKQSEVYLNSELHTLARQSPNFYFESVLRDETAPGFTCGDIVTLLKQQYPSLQHWCVFICGAPPLVQQLQKQCFLRGASLANIYTDPFISSPPNTSQ